MHSNITPLALSFLTVSVMLYVVIKINTAFTRLKNRFDDLTNAVASPTRADELCEEAFGLLSALVRRFDAMRKTHPEHVWQPLQLQLGECGFIELQSLKTECHSAATHHRFNRVVTYLARMEHLVQFIRNLDENSASIAMTDEARRLTSMAIRHDVDNALKRMDNSGLLRHVDTETLNDYRWLIEFCKESRQPQPDDDQAKWATFIKEARTAKRHLSAIQIRVALDDTEYENRSKNWNDPPEAFSQVDSDA